MTAGVRGVLVALTCLAVAACGHDFEPPDRSVRVERAAERYGAAIFDSLRWEGDAERELVGNTVYVERCRRCHGQLGRGDTDYVRERGLSVPSLVGADWPMADLDSLRRKLFIGHEDGMPIFGEGTLTPREIDATAWYVLLILRPEVLEEG